MFKDGPPCRDEVTTSLTCRDSIEVKTLTSSWMTAPASVPQVMISDSFHHSELSPPTVQIKSAETMKVNTTDTPEVIQTSEVSGASKLNEAASPYFFLAIRFSLR